LHPLADLRLKAEAERAPLLLDLELGPLALLQLLEVLARLVRVQAAPDGERAVHRLLRAAQLAHLG